LHVRYLLSAFVDIHSIYSFVFRLGQVECGVDDVHGAVECIHERDLDVAQLVCPERTHQRGGDVLPRLILVDQVQLGLLGRQDAALEREDETILK